MLYPPSAATPLAVRGFLPLFHTQQVPVL